MKTNLLEEARKIVAQEKLEAEESASQTKTGRTKKEIKKRFFEQITKFPNVIEMLSLRHSVNLDLQASDLAETTWNLSDAGVIYYTEDIGNPNLDLLQDEETVSRDGADHWTVYFAWAVKFGNIYNLDIYLIPYNNGDGFACTVVDEEGKSKTFIQDIPRNYALDQVVKYLRENTIL